MMYRMGIVLLVVVIVPVIFIIPHESHCVRLDGDGGYSRVASIKSEASNLVSSKVALPEGMEASDMVQLADFEDDSIPEPDESGPLIQEEESTTTEESTTLEPTTEGNIPTGDTDLPPTDDGDSTTEMDSTATTEITTTGNPAITSSPTPPPIQIPDDELFFKKPIGYITAAVGGVLIIALLGGAVGYLYWRRRQLIDSGKLKLTKNEV